MKERLILVGAIGLGAITGGGAILHHEQEQNHRIEIVESENQTLRSNQARDEALLCAISALTDISTIGGTDITPDSKGLAKCKQDAQKQYVPLFNRTPSPIPTGGKP